MDNQSCSTICTENKVEFYMTSNPWINNGLLRLAVSLENRRSTNGTLLEFKKDKVILKNRKYSNLIKDIDRIIHDLATQGTYNFNSRLKLLNKLANTNYKPPGDYPQSQEEAKEFIKIPKEERNVVKKEANVQSREKIWKQRSSYFGSRGNYYLREGLHFADSELAQDLIKQFRGKGSDVCPICADNTVELISRLKVKSSVNPLVGEHHNNVIEGYSHGKGKFTTTHIRRKLRACPKCIILSHVSLFDYYIPFFISSRDTYLALPLTQDWQVLKKVVNNLSIHGQYVNFSKPTTTSYSTNIRSLPHRSKSAAILALLHNIKNRYRREKLDTEKLFIEVIAEEFAQLTDWIVLSTNYSFTRISAEEESYSLFDLEEINGEELYLVPDLLANFRLRKIDDYTAEKFYKSILKLNATDFARALFVISKNYIADKSTLGGRLGYALTLWQQVFLNKILEVSIDMDVELKKACRKVAKSIGRNFNKNVGMLTKFAYASGSEEFKDALEDASFRLAKKSIDRNYSNVFVDEKSVERMYNALGDKDTFNDLKNYFVSFMSINVISANYTSKNKGDRNEI